MNSVMIRPILPTVPRIPDMSSDTALLVLSYTAFLLIVGAIAVFLGLYATKRFQGNKTKTTLAFVGITLVVSALLLCFFGCAVSAVKGCLLLFILLFSSYSDIKTRKADDWLSVMIVLTAFIGTEVADIPLKLLAAVLITLPMFLIIIVCHGKAVGGADVKLTAACTFMLGLVRGVSGLTAGLIVGIIINLIINMKKNKAEGFPLVPYLAAGFMAAYFI